MKTLLWMLSTVLLCACQQEVAPKSRPYGFPRLDPHDTTIVHDTLYLARLRLPVVRTMEGTVPEPQPGEIEGLRECFRKWQEEEVGSGRMLPRDSCNWDWIERHKDVDQLVWGLPDSTEFQYFYSDLNQDQKLDQMVTFGPAQCDGGNASMWSKLAVLTISTADGYSTAAHLGDGMADFIRYPQEGFVWMDSLGPGIIYGTHFVFKEGDGHCCPSIQNAMIFAWPGFEALYEEHENE